MSNENERYVVVTTDKDRRGVFGGRLIEFNRDKQTAILEDARMAVYWSAKVRGVLGLAANGPTACSRISRAVPRIEINGVTAVMDMSPEAKKAWDEEPWG